VARYSEDRARVGPGLMGWLFIGWLANKNALNRLDHIKILSKF
jgi:hypothetical protein